MNSPAFNVTVALPVASNVTSCFVSLVPEVNVA